MRTLFQVSLFGFATVGAYASDGRVLDGHVIDASTGKPIAEATVTLGSKVVLTDGAGVYRIEGEGERIMARAPGYRASSYAAHSGGKAGGELSLTPFVPRALYLSIYGIGSKPIRDAALEVIHHGGANALVIDVKGDRGLLPYPSEIAMAKSNGARAVTTVRSLPDLVNNGHAQGIYMIARIVTFKDDPLAKARPELAIKRADGSPFRDNEGLGWTDPYQPEVRAYNVAIAVEAAKAGFDEVQFDYVRFPDSSMKMRFAGPTDEPGRVKAISDFLRQAHAALVPYNTFQAADIFGYVSWNTNDTGIGQQLDEVVKIVDYLCPMLYPSGFKFGIPGHKNPMDSPYDIVRLTLDNAVRRTHANPKKFRPWLQAFRDYAFGHQIFGPAQISGQTRAAADAGTDGWLLWNPHNNYRDLGLTGGAAAQTAVATSSAGKDVVAKN